MWRRMTTYITILIIRHTRVAKYNTLNMGIIIQKAAYSVTRESILYDY